MTEIIATLPRASQTAIALLGGRPTFAETVAIVRATLIVVTTAILIRNGPETGAGLPKVVATEVEVLSTSDPLPFPIDDASGHKGGEVGEEARLKHRYLDLRRSGPNAALRLRSKINKAARDVLAGHAATQYQSLFAQIREQVASQRLTLTTRVVRAGVVSLTGRRARLLVFLDQTAQRAGGAATSAAAQLSVTAQYSAGHWRITELTAR